MALKLYQPGGGREEDSGIVRPFKCKKILEKGGSPHALYALFKRYEEASAEMHGEEGAYILDEREFWEWWDELPKHTRSRLLGLYRSTEHDLQMQQKRLNDGKEEIRNEIGNVFRPHIADGA